MAALIGNAEDNAMALKVSSIEQVDHVFYLATNKHLKYETQGEVVSLA